MYLDYKFDTDVLNDKSDVIELWITSDYECDCDGDGDGEDCDCWIEGDCKEFAEFKDCNPQLECVTANGRSVKYRGTVENFEKSGVL